MEWIKCSERLPEERKEVLVGHAPIGVGEGEVVVAYLNKEKWWYYDSGELEIMRVKWNSEFGEMEYWTHWMPLPEPPAA